MPVFQLDERIIFPPPELAESNGLLAIGGDLSPERLIAAYRLGIFPWFSEGEPILWWFTTPRLVLYPDELHIPRRLQRELKKKVWSITFDTAFAHVVNMCSTVRTGQHRETWITESMIKGYIQLHELGYSHSVECWNEGELVGGLYGVALDRIFFGESMFTIKSNSSKICLIHLVKRLQKYQYRLIDCQMTTDHLLQFGTREVSGSVFRQELQNNIMNLSPDGVWCNDISLNRQRV